MLGRFGILSVTACNAVDHPVKLYLHPSSPRVALRVLTEHILPGLSEENSHISVMHALLESSMRLAVFANERPIHDEC